MSIKKFPYKGRIIQSGPDSTGKNTLYGYEASSTEADRIRNTYGEQYVSTATGKSVVFIGGYTNNDRNKPVFLPTSNDKAILQGISNYDLSNAINNDPNFYRQATGNQSNNTTPEDPNQPGTPGTSTPTDTPNQNATPKQQVLTYPSDIKGDQDRINFQACRINERGGNLINTPTYTPIGGTVVMAVQAPISDQNSVDWGPDSVNAIDAKIYEKSLELIKKGDFSKTIQGTAEEILKFGLGNTSIIQKFLAGQAANLNNVLARTDNVVLNPNLELLFQGPQLRPFSFQFKMSARNEFEAKQIKAIIRYFKQNMAVKRESNLFLKAPNVFTIRYVKDEENHPGINMISPDSSTKACALTNCSVDYTPLGTYMTYKDGTMVSYTLSLQFQELTPVYANDYDEGKAKTHPIGY
jgi:hypothetical protein